MKKILASSITSVAIFGMAFVPTFADSVNVNFELPTYVTGNINSQDSWVKTGSFDVEVSTNSYGYPTFGGQALRISDSITSGSFGDQAFAKPLTNAVGELDSTDGTFSRGILQNHFETQFDIASTVPGAQQPGMHISVSPDRGDGSRMSYLRFEDGSTGLDVFFDDVQGTTNPANFVETQIATGLDRSLVHKVKLAYDTFDGASNDVVKVWIDDALVITGTSWENYYRFDSEASSEQSPRIVKTILFRESGTATPANAGKGFLVDNISIVSGPQAPALIDPPTNKNQCKNDGWMIFNNPAFINKKECEKYVKDHKKDGKAEGLLQLSGPKQKIKFEVSEKDNDHKVNKVEYWNYEYPGVLHYKAKAMCVSVDKATKEARFMFQIPEGWPGLSGMYVVSYVKEVKHGVDLYGHSATADLVTATAWCNTGVGFSPSMYSINKGEVEVE